MIYLKLFFEFFKIGMFAVGGGMVAIPFLQDLGERTGWYPQSLITDMIAISESTPGPIGINMATYVGNNVAGILGGIVATIGEIVPSIIIVVLVSRMYDKFKASKLVTSAFYGLRPAVAGLIGAAAISVMQVALFTQHNLPLSEMINFIHIKGVIFFAVIFFAVLKYKKSPFIYIALSAVVGIVFKF